MNPPGSPTAADLVASLEHANDGWKVLAEIGAFGADAPPAVYVGLCHANWRVRRWCAAYLDRNGASAELRPLIPLLRDAHSTVRVWAVHSLSCDRCKAAERAIGVVPLLIERLENDPSLRVRRMAAAMLAYGPKDQRATAALETILRRETDRKLRRHASLGLLRQGDKCKAMNREVGWN